MFLSLQFTGLGNALTSNGRYDRMPNRRQAIHKLMMTTNVTDPYVSNHASPNYLR